MHSANRLNGLRAEPSVTPGYSRGVTGGRPRQKVRLRTNHPEKVLRLFLRHFAAPAQNFRFRAGGFGFFDVPGAVVEQRKTCPADLIVRP